MTAETTRRSPRRWPRRPITLVLLALGALGAGIYTWGPPFLARADAGTAYVAKAMCSGVLMAGLEPERLMNEELALAQGLVTATVDERAGEVHASALLGLVEARARRQGDLGCSLYDGDVPPVALPDLARGLSPDPQPATAPWPLAPHVSRGPPEGVDAEGLEAALDAAFSEPNPEDPTRTRAVVVVHGGWVVAERYAAGITAQTPLTGWSMTKSLTHALAGIAVADGLLALHAPLPVPEWSALDDPRGAITLDQMLRMSSGLAFEEVYDDFTSDVIVMLMRARDAGGVAAAQPLENEPDALWYYSSGTTNVIARALRHAMADDEAYWRFPYDRLFGPLGMSTAVIETDPSGSFVGSSYGYASARDWARFGLLYLADGVWAGERILPEGWVEYGVTPTPAAADARYGAHWWLNAGGRYPGVPRDEFRAQGFDGQLLMVIPSRDTVIVRLGQTPGDGFDAEDFERDVLAALPKAPA